MEHSLPLTSVKSNIIDWIYSLSLSEQVKFASQQFGLDAGWSNGHIYVDGNFVHEDQFSDMLEIYIDGMSDDTIVDLWSDYLNSDLVWLLEDKTVLWRETI